MIVVEERLGEVFEQLPLVVGFKPIYDFGDKHHLIKLLKAYSDEAKSPYPLVYQLSTKSKQNELVQEGETNLVLMIATRNDETALFNKNRWATSYRNVLIPTAKHVVTALTKGGIFVWNFEYEIDNYPNYGSGEENFTTDIWDAIRLTTRITITDGCINTIRF